MAEVTRRLHCRRFSAAALIAVLAVLGACKDEGKQHEEQLTQLLAVLPGEYDNTAQAAQDVRNGVRPGHDAVTLIITHVYTPRLGHHTYYAQETAAGDPRRVLSQKMYDFESDDQHGIVEKVYQFTEPVRWRDGQLNKEVFTSVDTADVQAEGCVLLWKQDAGRFVATHDPKGCPDAAGGAATQAEFSLGVLTLGDYKFNKVR
jgi:hypothetical protein